MRVAHILASSKKFGLFGVLRRNLDAVALMCIASSPAAFPAGVPAVRSFFLLASKCGMLLGCIWCI